MSAITALAGIDAPLLIRALHPEPWFVDEAAGEGPSALMHRLIDHLTGGLTPDTLVRDALNRQDFARLAELHELAGFRNTAVEAEVHASWSAHESALRARYDAVRDALDNAGAKLHGAPEQADIGVVHELLAELPLPLLGDTPSRASVREASRCSSELANIQSELDRILDDHALRIAEDRAAARDLCETMVLEALALLQADDPQGRAKGAAMLRGVAACAPELELASLRAVQEGRVLVDAQVVPKQAPVRPPPLGLGAQFGRQPARSPLVLSPLAEVTLQYTKPSPYENFPTTQEQAETLPSARARAGVYLSTARGLATSHVDRPQLLAEGLRNLGHDALRRARYSSAVTSFMDALAAYARATHDRAGVPQAVSGAILSAWLPTAGEPAAAEIAGRLDDAPLPLDEALHAVHQDRKAQVVSIVWEQFTDRAAEALFLDAVLDAGTMERWAPLLIEKALHLRSLGARPERWSSKLISLMRVLSPEVPEQSLIDLRRVVDAPPPGSRYPHALREALTRLDPSIPEVARAAWTHAVHELCDNLAGDTRPLQDPASALSLRLEPVSTKLYPKESEEIEFAVWVHVGKGAPGSALAIELSLTPDAVSAGILVDEGRLELGAVEPDSIVEALFNLTFDDTRVVDLASVEVTLRVFQGNTVVTPSDSRSRFAVQLIHRQRPSENPYVTGTALINSAKSFVGREADLQRVRDTLIGQQQDNVPFVVGIRRIGKTSLLKRIVDDNDIRRRYIPVFYDLQPMPETQTTADFFADLATTIRDQVQKDARETWTLNRQDIREAPESAFPRFLQQLNNLRTNRRLLLVFDEFEKLMSNLERWKDRAREEHLGSSQALVGVLPILRSVLHHNPRVSMILSGVPSARAAFHGEAARLYGNLIDVPLRALTEADAKALARLAEPHVLIPVRLQEELHHLSGGQPYLLQSMLHSLYSRVRCSGHSAATERDLEAVVHRNILPNASHFTDFIAIARESASGDVALRALAAVRQESRRFVTEALIAAETHRLGEPLEVDDLHKRLEALAHPDLGLVERAPNRRDAWRLVIGLLGRHLQRELT